MCTYELKDAMRDSVILKNEKIKRLRHLLWRAHEAIVFHNNGHEKLLSDIMEILSED